LELDTGKPSTTNPGFSGQAWTRNVDLYEAIRTMPFNAELAAGSLSEGRFRHYIGPVTFGDLAGFTSAS
jgi:hypothetical protein